MLDADVVLFFFHFLFPYVCVRACVDGGVYTFLC